ncbi:IucA/IucC family siderophore biosynthesis protein [Paenibacillus sp. JGP012]|uniref:IucA/IucC family protein n=1 Tax=Paenibacillus sp. JGP012 TaxID=2735914 RepID=UPI0021A9B90F|nr:IucA/IucC family protein [Paenibacillus sp. JGP012]
MEIKRKSRAAQQADEHTCKLLLNCYIRELGPERAEQIQLNPDMLTYSITFPCSGVEVTGKLSYYSAMGEHEYVTMNCNGESVHYHNLVRWISAEVVDQTEHVTDRVNDFAHKVENSVSNLTLYMEQGAGGDFHNYMTSEQSLLYGHPFHPFPKNSSGFTTQDVHQYSPELRTSFQLCYIAVRQDVYTDEWVEHADKINLHHLLASYDLPVSNEKMSMYRLLPVHPWQYEHVSHLDEVQSYIREEKLLLLGRTGPLVYPTSSVRTVYVPDWSCNIKLSLNMQITNMIRTNNAEQMRRTLDASRYVWQQECFAAEPQTHIAYETGVATCRFEDEQLTSLFTIAYRPIEFDPANTYVLSSLVESPFPGAPSRLITILEDRAGSQVEQWFELYLNCSLLPLVRAAEEKGIHFEAHLQNTLVTLKQGMPVAFIVRDLEGVSVDRESVSERPHHELLFYSREQAWARTSYYFIVNHLGSLIHVLARDMGVPEEHFWMQVRDALKAELARTGNIYVRHLLNADAFLAKQNLVSCLTGISQTPAYVRVRNVMKCLGSEAREIHGYRN